MSYFHSLKNDILNRIFEECYEQLYLEIELLKLKIMI